MKGGLKPCVAATFLLAANALSADEGEPLSAGQGQFEGTFVGTYQKLDSNEVNDELLFSLDLTYQYQFEGVGVFAWFEYAEPTDNNEVSAYNENYNADAGTITAKNGQFSEFYLYGQLDDNGEPSWRFGINEVTTLIDRSSLANDEVAEFLSLPMVNNLTIAFPDYALSGFYQDVNAFDGFGYRVVLSSSHGFADNDSGSYKQLTDVGSDGKGVFSAVELVFERKHYDAYIGYWKNSADASGESGFYGTLDYFLKRDKLNFRYGEADAQNGNAEQFFSAAWQRNVAEGILSLGYSFTRFNQVNDAIMRAAELYYRKAVSEQLFVSPALQWGNGNGYNGDDVLLSIRLEYGF